MIRYKQEKKRLDKMNINVMMNIQKFQIYFISKKKRK